MLLSSLTMLPKVRGRIPRRLRTTPHPGAKLPPCASYAAPADASASSAVRKPSSRRIRPSRISNWYAQRCSTQIVLRSPLSRSVATNTSRSGGSSISSCSRHSHCGQFFVHRSRSSAMPRFPPRARTRKGAGLGHLELGVRERHHLLDAAAFRRPMPGAYELRIPGHADKLSRSTIDWCPTVSTSQTPTRRTR